MPEVRNPDMASPSYDPTMLQSSHEKLNGKYRSQTQTTTSTHTSPNSNSSLTNTNDRVVVRKSHDARLSSGSIFLRPERSESLAKTLMTRGSKLLRRQNSRSDSASLRTWQWLETPHDDMSTHDGHSANAPGDPRHNRMHSTGSKWRGFCG